MNDTRTSLNITKETMKRIWTVGGKMMTKNGKYRSAEDIVKELINFWEAKSGK
jgi:hypothetical protein